MADDADIDELIDSVVQQGLDDWIPLAGLSIPLYFYGWIDPSDIEAKALAIERLVRELLARDLVVIGNDRFNDDGSFRAFDGDQESAIAWLIGVVRGQEPSWDFAAWLANTERGDERARSRPTTRYMDYDPLEDPWPRPAPGLPEDRR